jgi:hypothetical protein
LASYYFDRRTTNVLRFLLANTKSLLDFLLPGRIIAVSVVACALVAGYSAVRTRHGQPVLCLAFTSVSVVIVASVGGIYPYGGVRQCIFLAPIIVLVAGTIFAQLIDRLRRSAGIAAMFVIVGIISLSGYEDLIRHSPYGEVEDIKAVLNELAKSSAPTDRVYIYWGAAPAVNFYLRGSDRRLIYGEYHEREAQKYVPEILALIRPDTARLWLVFSHPVDSVEQRIIGSLRQTLDLRPALAVSGANLYVAQYCDHGSAGCSAMSGAVASPLAQAFRSVAIRRPAMRDLRRAAQPRVDQMDTDH